jgi:hypothetical protein
VGGEATATPAPVASPPTDGAAAAQALADAGELDRAIAIARRLIARDPHDAEARRALATAYQRKLWCSDALEELERAVRDRPSLGADAQVGRVAVGCLTRRTQGRAERFLLSWASGPALGVVREAATGSPNPEIRRAAEGVATRAAGR